MNNRAFLYRENRIQHSCDAGYSAYRNGEPIENNPYIEDDYREAWQRGWLQAEWEEDNHE